MIDWIIPSLLVAGLSLAGAVAGFKRRGRIGTPLSQLSTTELEMLRQSLRPDVSMRELRHTLILVEEEIRRRQLLITHE